MGSKKSGGWRGVSDTEYEIIYEDSRYSVREAGNSYEIKLDERIFDFAVEIIKYLKKFDRYTIDKVIVTQLVRAVTSIGANYEEAQGASSNDDFLYKLTLCHREAKETNYWLRILKASEIDRSENLEKLLKESQEIRNILGSIVGKLRRKKQ